MASESENGKRCFTITWKIENASYYCETYELASPSFAVEEINRTQWALMLNLSIENKYGHLGFFLQRLDDSELAENVAIDYELAFVALDGTVPYTWEEVNSVITKNVRFGPSSSLQRNHVFFKRKSELLPQDALTVRCRIWKSVGEMSQNVQCFVRTHIVVKKVSFLWNIRAFSGIQQLRKKTCKVKYQTGKRLMSLKLFTTRGIACDGKISLVIKPDFQNIKLATIEVSIVDASQNIIKCFKGEFWHRNGCNNKCFTLPYAMNDFLKDNSPYLQNDVLSLSFKYAFSAGNLKQKIEWGSRINEWKDSSLDIENDPHASIRSLINDLKLLLKDCIHSDIKLKANGLFYPVHKCILSVRSPEFKSIFSSKMIENADNCLEVKYLMKEDIVPRILHYIYFAEVDDLEWCTAKELYEAADYFKILKLKDICASYLKGNLDVYNACEALELAHKHQDEVMKGFVQNFIKIHRKRIINFKQWAKLKETNSRLAAETNI